jgi:hypothetical protein
MEKTIDFQKYMGSTLELKPTVISCLMKKVGLHERYIDNHIELVYIRIADEKALIVDPHFPIIKKLLEEDFVCEYDTQYMHNVKFSNDGENWLSVDELFQNLNYMGKLPIVSLSHVYMRIVDIEIPSLTQEEIHNIMHEKLNNMQRALTIEEVKAIVNKEIAKLIPPKTSNDEHIAELKKTTDRIKQDFNKELEELKKTKQEVSKIINAQLAKIQACADSMQRKNARANLVVDSMTENSSYKSN